MKKFFGVLILLMLNSCAHGFELPEKISSWHSVGEFVTPLTASANSQDLGKVIYKDYERDKPKGMLQIILTAGKGTGGLYVPENVNNSKDLLPSESQYKILNVNGRKAILEIQPYMPLALAVEVEKNTVLTIETKSLNENELLKFAEEFVK